MKKSTSLFVGLYPTRILIALLLTGFLTSLNPRPCLAQVYCNVTDVQVKAMPNGVQITVVADGILEWDSYDNRGGKVTQVALLLENARSKIDRNFIPVNQTPPAVVAERVATAHYHVHGALADHLLRDIHVIAP